MEAQRLRFASELNDTKQCKSIPAMREGIQPVQHVVRGQRFDDAALPNPALSGHIDVHRRRNSRRGQTY